MPVGSEYAFFGKYLQENTPKYEKSQKREELSWKYFFFCCEKCDNIKYVWDFLIEKIARVHSCRRCYLI